MGPSIEMDNRDKEKENNSHVKHLDNLKKPHPDEVFF